MVESGSQRKKSEECRRTKFFSCRSMVRRPWPNRKYKSFWLNDVMTYICITYSIMRANSCATRSPICNCYRTPLAATFKLATIPPKTTTKSNANFEHSLHRFFSSFSFNFSAAIDGAAARFFPFISLSRLIRANSNKNIHGESVCQRFHLCEIDFTGKSFLIQRAKIQ